MVQDLAWTFYISWNWKGNFLLSQNLNVHITLLYSVALQTFCKALASPTSFIHYDLSSAILKLPCPGYKIYYYKLLWSMLNLHSLFPARRLELLNVLVSLVFFLNTVSFAFLVHCAWYLPAYLILHDFITFCATPFPHSLICLGVKHPSLHSIVNRNGYIPSRTAPATVSRMVPLTASPGAVPSWWWGGSNSGIWLIRWTTHTCLPPHQLPRSRTRSKTFIWLGIIAHSREGVVLKLGDWYGVRIPLNKMAQRNSAWRLKLWLFTLALTGVQWRPLVTCCSNRIKRSSK